MPSRHMNGAGLGSRQASYNSEQDSDDGETAIVTDRTPLMTENLRPNSSRRKSPVGYGAASPNALRPRSKHRRPSVNSSKIKNRRMTARKPSFQGDSDDYDINNPPSIPGSPTFPGQDNLGEVIRDEFSPIGSPSATRTRSTAQHFRDTIIDIDRDAGRTTSFSASSPPEGSALRRRPTGETPLEDVCVPFDQMTEVPEEDEYMRREGSDRIEPSRRRHKKPWPDISALEEWSRDEKEERTQEGIRAKKVNEPEFVGGRLRPSRVHWQREEEEEATFRFTYFNEDLDSSLKSYTLSGLEELGLSFTQLFIPEPKVMDESSSDEEDDIGPLPSTGRATTPVTAASRIISRQTSLLDHRGWDRQSSIGEGSEAPTPSKQRADDKPQRLGPRPVFWLDVLKPTYEEMRVISRAFGIHKLTAEDIMEEEQREKVELFRNYYFVNYRTFVQDQNSPDYLDPVNMYFVVFKGGVISFHFSQMPHPASVRRRIRQLSDYQYTDSDWISYAIIDSITDAYAPLIEQIEKEVDEIDEEILQLHSTGDSDESSKAGQPSSKRDKFRHRSDERRQSIYEKIGSGSGEDMQEKEVHSGDMLLWVGECRKRVMGLYRLLGNKADVIKGLAKRCNEQWQVAPRSDVGLYLGDIQDHIVTMTANLTHYENILSRAHSNYLAQINIKMTERAEQTNDVLNKMTVLGTIVLPMNIITGMWGMNVTVPGQDNGNMAWFWGITAGLFAFGFICFFLARTMYRVV